MREEGRNTQHQQDQRRQYEIADRDAELVCRLPLSTAFVTRVRIRVTANDYDCCTT